MTVLLGADIATALTGVFFVETVFAIPGLGYTGLSAIQNLDYPVITGVIIVAALIAVLANTIVDLLHAALDPRLRRVTGSGRHRHRSTTSNPEAQRKQEYTHMTRRPRIGDSDDQECTWASKPEPRRWRAAFALLLAACSSGGSSRHGGGEPRRARLSRRRQPAP